MPTPRFIQIHSLHICTATLLNRDDSGLAKRLPYGGAMRTRVSSQCLKRHWRMDDGPFSLAALPGAETAVRSRELVTRGLREPLDATIDKAILDAIEPAFQIAVYGKDAAKGKSNRQPLIFGEPELRFLSETFAAIARAATTPVDAKSRAEAFCDDKNFKSAMKTMRDGASLPAGLVSALFGRMTARPGLFSSDASHACLRAI